MTETATPTPEARIATLDVLRGVAVMGIFSVNVIGFAMPFEAYLNPAAYGGTHGAALAIWALNFVLIDGKMRGLFTLLFGASMLLVIERAEAAGRSAARIHFARMAWLLLFGCLHYYLIWSGDILTLYASIGAVAFFFRRLPASALVGLGIGCLAFDLAMTASFALPMAAKEAAAQAPHASARTIAGYREMTGFIAPLDPSRLRDTLALYRSGFGAIFHDRVTTGLNGPLDQLRFGWSETLGSVLLGMAALNGGFLTGAWSNRRYAWIAAVGMLAGAAGFGALAWRGWSSGFRPAIMFEDFFLFAQPARLAMMFGYAALIILLSRRGGWLAQRIAAVGRAAFTNYLGTSLVASTIFFGWGFGLFGRLDRFQAWLFVPVFWLVMLLWSKPWLDRFTYGPFEWLWRSLARWSPQPMRRMETASASPGRSG